MTILELDESFKTMNRPDPNRHVLVRPWRSLTVFFLEIVKDNDVKFWYKLVLTSIGVNKIWDLYLW